MFDQSKVGQSFPPFTLEVERGEIHELALAIGDDNPIYHSQEAAQAAAYADVPLFPTFPTIFAFWGNTQKIEQLTSLGIPVQRILHGQEAYEYLAPILPGDILTGVMTLTAARTTQSRNGSSMDILTFETGYTNQEGKAVLNAREVILVRS
jgi:acyl dehydratase